MDSNNPKIIALLKKGEIYLNQTPKWPDYIKEYNFTDADIDDLIALVVSEELNSASSSSAQVWAPVHAWRVLGQLKAAKAVEPIIQFLDRFEDDDFAHEELPEVFGLIGEPAIEPLVSYLKKTVNDEFSHVLVVSGLAEIAMHQHQLRKRILSIFSIYMQNPWEESQELNGCLISSLVDLEAIELIDDIRYLFELDCVDISSCGDIEDVEIDLGLRHKRETPRPILYELDEMQKIHQETQQGDNNFYLSGNNISTYTRETVKVGRNDPCPCSSGKKFKKCCGSNS